jgi:type IV pilus assembly protein PilQ
MQQRRLRLNVNSRFFIKMKKIFISCLLSLILMTAHAGDKQVMQTLKNIRLRTKPNVKLIKNKKLIYHESQPERDPFNSVDASHWLSASIALHYLKVKELVKLIQKNRNNLLSKRGVVVAAPEHNLLWVRDYAGNVQKIKRFIAAIDRPSPIVLIKVKVVNVDRDYVKNLGVVFHTNNTDDQDNNDDVQADVPQMKSSLDSVTIPVLKFRDSVLLNMQLTALEQQGHARVISSPELMTLNQQAAQIESGEEIPYQERTGQGNTSVAFKKAVLRLKVTPTLMPNNNVLLHLQINQDKVSALTVNGVPAIRTQQLQTQVLVKNKQTFVLGGIYETIVGHQTRGVPVLRHIPLLGFFFREHRRVQERRELLILVTPIIVAPNEQ